MIYSPLAIDYEKGLRIYDPFTKKNLSEEEAINSPAIVRSRLLNKSINIGCEVLSLEEANNIIVRKRTI